MLRITRSFAIAGAVVLVGSLAACGHNRSAPAPQYSGGYSGGYQTAPAYPNNPAGTEYGRVSNIEALQGRSQGQTSGAGAVIGAVVGGVLGNQIGNVDRNASAGTASAMASAGLPQAYLPGKSMAAVAGATYRGQSAMAVGVSTITDNGKWVFKGSLNSNTRGYVGATVGAGFQW